MRAVTTCGLPWLCGLLLAGCASGGDDEGGAGMAGDGAASPDGFEVAVMPLVDEACRCHQTEPILMAPFSLKHGEAYDNLVGVASLDVPSMVRVAPGSLNQSYLWHKVSGTQLEVMGKGQIMPPTVPLTQQERDVFGRWIAAGAPR